MSRARCRARSRRSRRTSGRGSCTEQGRIDLRLAFWQFWGMQAPRREFGSTGVQVPTLGQGTWQMEGDDRKAVIAALRLGIELGLTHIDTAELYGSGRVEEMVAEAISGRRDELYLVSKVMPSHASRSGTI